MNPEKFTIKAREAIAASQKLAESAGQQQIESGHLLLALLEQGEGIIVPILRKLGADPVAIAAELRAAVAALPKVSGTGAPQAYVSLQLQQLLDAAGQIADRLKDDYVST
ncbi:MAG: Clp protease N-terminal domain-containing protein, partial [Actinomycetota bacterium]